MTSGFRLLLALFLAAGALAVGLTGSERRQTASVDREARIAQPVDPWMADEVDALVGRIVASGLYPDAEPLGDMALAVDTDTEALGIDAVEAAFADPALAAFLNRGDGWTICIAREDGSCRMLQIGDVLADDWQVAAISATSVTFEREGRTRTLDAYPSREG